MSYKKKIKTWVRRQDIYGVPINLTYKNENTFQTMPGGVITLMYRCVIFAFLLFQVSDLFKKVNTISRITIH